MKSKHTPGPWEVREGYKDCADVFDAEGFQIAEVPWSQFNTNTKVLADDRVISAEEQLANGHIIAAAPELLETLKQIVSTCEFLDIVLPRFTYENSMSGVTKSVNALPLLDEAKAAIAKAEGRD